MLKLNRIVPLVGLLALVGCQTAQDGTVTLTPVAKGIVTVACGIDGAVPGVVSVVGAVITIADPTTAGAVLLANQADRLAHPAVVAACQVAVPGSVPVAVGQQ